MPKNLQIYNFKQIFLKANRDFDDPSAEMDNIDWEAVIDSTLSFGENLHNLEENYPQYRWRVPK